MEPVLDVKAPQTPGLAVSSTPLPASGIKEPAQTNEVKGSFAASRKMIHKDELHKKIQAGESIQIVNVLDPEKYVLGFIKGSLKIPVDKLDARISELDKSKPVVTYCAGGECNASKSAAAKLASKGFNVSVYEGGIREWKAAGLPMDA